jgi:hypothetical protein
MRREGVGGGWIFFSPGAILAPADLLLAPPPAPLFPPTLSDRAARLVLLNHERTRC